MIVASGRIKYGNVNLMERCIERRQPNSRVI